MLLVGQYDSPFVRRVAVTMHLYEIPFTRDRTSVFSPDMARVHPLVRIPTLVLDDGEKLWDSAAILDYLDERVGPGVAITPHAGAERRRVLRATVLASGAVEKAGAIVYERHLHKAGCVSEEWVARCRGQLDGALAHLEAEAGSPWFFGDALTQTDVTTACLVAYLRMRQSEAFPAGRYPRLEAISARCDEVDAFARTKPAADEVMPEKGSARR